MSTVYSKSHRIHLEVSPTAYEATNLTWNYQHKATVLTADLLTALDAVPKADFDKAVALSEDRQTKLEAAEAKLEKVRGFRDSLAESIVDSDAFPNVVPLEGLLSLLDKALNLEPEFVLPTDPGVRFEARYGRNDTTDAFQSVAYRDSEGGPVTLYVREANLVAYTAKEVMREFTGHRLIEDAA